MIPIRDNLRSREVPIVTYTIIALNVIIYLWDRQMRFTGSNVVFADLALKPSDVLTAFRASGDPLSLANLFTYMFLHGSLVHIIFNLVFLLAFGPNVESALGSVRFTIYYLFWGIVAGLTEVLVVPGGVAPIVGASGAIGGVLGAYFMLFPGSRIQLMLWPLVFWEFEATAWILLGMWFVYQIVWPQQGVANWAHAGGFFAGMLTILIMGGRKAVLHGKSFEEVPDG